MENRFIYSLETRPQAMLADGRMVDLQVRDEKLFDDSATLHSWQVCMKGLEGATAIRVAQLDLGLREIDVFQEQFYMPSGPRGFRHLVAGTKPPAIKWWGARAGNEWQLLCHPFAVVKAAGHKPVLIGFATGSRFESYVLLDTSGPTITLSAWCDLGGKQPPLAGWLNTEQFYVRAGLNFADCVDAYARHVAAISKARLPRRTVTGWNDWQYYREEKDEKALRTSLDVLRKMRRQGCDLEYVILDGGWCDHASEWLEPCAKFPSGMKAISAELRRKGMKLGLWLAPFITNVKTKVVREHPEWMVRDAATDGPLTRKQSNVGEANVIDFTVGGALDWLREVVRTMVDDWKVGYIKLDGPSLAHYYGGKLHDPSVTSLEAIESVMRAIRQAAGDDVIIEGEGIYEPSIGYVETQRISQDNHPFWYSPQTGQPCLKENMKNELLGSYMHNVLWHIHRENVILRDFLSPLNHRTAENPAIKDSTLNENELRSYLSAATLSGGSMLLTDPMDQLARSPERMELISQFLPHYEEGNCRPLDVFNAGYQPSLYVRPICLDFENWHVLGVFNSEDLFQDFTVNLREAVGKDAVHAFDFWGQQYLGAFRGRMAVRDVPAHGCRMIALRQVRDVPQLVGTNLHMLQGAVEIKECRLEKDTLRIVVNHWMQKERRLHVWCPPAWRLKGIKTNARDHLLDTRKPPIISLQYNGRRRTQFDLRFTRTA